MPSVQIIRSDAPDYPAKARACLRLIRQIWPSDESPDADAETIERWQLGNYHHFVIWEGEEALAHAGLFVREILTERGSLPVGALGGVCVHPDYRGHGWGRDVTRAAFDFLPRLGVSVSLFQTPVPDFYARLGARLVSNRFHNGPDEKDPFIDIHKMIFPAAVDWPSGDIDINGPGY